MKMFKSLLRNWVFKDIHNQVVDSLKNNLGVVESVRLQNFKSVEKYLTDASKSKSENDAESVAMSTLIAVLNLMPILITQKNIYVVEDWLKYHPRIDEELKRAVLGYLSPLEGMLSNKPNTSFHMGGELN